MPQNLSHRIQSSMSRRLKKAIEPLPGLAFSSLNRNDLRPKIAYVSDGAGWVLDQIGYQIASRLQDRYQMRVADTYRGYRDCIVHFAAPPIYLKNKVYRHVHPSNRLLLTWTHGLPDNPDPNVQLQLEHMVEGEAYLSRIMVPTRTAYDYLRSQGIVEEKIIYIPLGVDTAHFHPPSLDQRREARARLGIPDGVFCIGSFQKDSPGWDNRSKEMKWVKGPDTLIKVLEKLAANYPIFVLLTTPARGYVVEALDRLGIPYRQDNLDKADDLAGYFHALDLYLLTSRDEGGPMAFLESLSSGVPVVSTRMGIPLDAVRQGENGFLAPVEDVEGLTESVSRVFDSPALADSLALAGRETALTYDWSLVVDKYATLLYKFSV